MLEISIRIFVHVSEFHSKLPIRSQWSLHILSLLCCVLVNPTSPSYLNEKCIHLGETSELRSSRRLMLNLPLHKSKYFSQSFTVHAIKLWDSLPLPIRGAKSLLIFKKHVKDYYLKMKTI